VFESSELGRAAELRVGKILKAKWRLDALIGIGGMAAVYAATHRNGSRVAIKVLHRHLCASEKQVRRFLREAYTANRVGHPGAVAVFDDDIDGDDAFLVMDLLTGTNLKDHAQAQGGRLSTSETLSVLDDLLRVLEEAHVRGIVHRDIKPSNLFLTKSGVLKVLDFGVARSLAALPDLHSTIDGDLIGTPAFMSPEQARGQHALVDARSDIWSVGATVFTLLSGELVHAGSTATEHLSLAMSASARSLRSTRPDLPAQVIEIVDRCLRYDPEQRWADAASLRKALRGLDVAATGRALPDSHSQITPAPISTLASRPPAARPGPRPALLAAAGVLGMVAVALLGRAQFGGHAAQQPSNARSAAREHAPVPMSMKASRASAAPAPPSSVSTQSHSVQALARPTLAASSAAAGERSGAFRGKRHSVVSSSAPHSQAVSPEELGALSTNPLDKRH
jgi:serine/threonine protein kinase